MENLSFKVSKKEPEVIYVTKETKLPNALKENLGSQGIAYRGKVYLFRKSLPKYVVEHEKAHIAIGDVNKSTWGGTTHWLDDEVKADLVTYHKVKQPHSIAKRINDLAGDVIFYHSTSDEKKKYNYYELIGHMLIHIKKIYTKYWDYLPNQWKDDYKGFISTVEKSLQKQRMEGKDKNPSHDYIVGRLKNGGYNIQMAKVVKKKGKRYVDAGMVSIK